MDIESEGTNAAGPYTAAIRLWNRQDNLPETDTFQVKHRSHPLLLQNNRKYVLESL